MVGYYKLNKTNVEKINMPSINIEKNLYTLWCPLIVEDKDILPAELACLYDTLEIPIITISDFKDFDFSKYEEKKRYLEELSKYLNLNTSIELIEEKKVGHLLFVGYYSKLLSDKLDLSKELKNKIYLAALFHDVGKYNIPASILGKEGKLTKEEYDLVKKHCLFAKDILKDFFDEEIISIIVSHHERCDKSGYPYGIEPSLGAKIVAIADSYDAMIKKRVYSKAKTKEEAIKELNLCTKSVLEGGKGILYDKDLVLKFTNIILSL